MTLELRIGTRASPLARWQAQWVAGELTARGARCELVSISTRGDEIQRDPIGNLGDPGVFTKELQRSLLSGAIDLAVHSLKDLPTERVDGLRLAAVPVRDTPFDVLVTRDGRRLEDLRRGATVGTGSLRRRAQLLHLRGDLQMQHIRGNVDGRLRKLNEQEFDAIVLAHAGLKRLGLEDCKFQVLEPQVCLPAVGQGALGIEIRTDDLSAAEFLAKIDDAASHQAATAERALLAALRGGCLAPVGAWARPDPDGLVLAAVVLSPSGDRRLAAEHAGNIDASVELGERVAADLLNQGAATLIDEARRAL